MRSIATGLFSVLAAVVVVVIGALLFGDGLHRDWQWMTNGGVFLAVLGLMFR